MRLKSGVPLLNALLGQVVCCESVLFDQLQASYLAFLAYFIDDRIAEYLGQTEMDATLSGDQRALERWAALRDGVDHSDESEFFGISLT